MRPTDFAMHISKMYFFQKSCAVYIRICLLVLDMHMHNTLICHKYYLGNKSCFGYDFSWTSTELQNGNVPLKSQKRYPSHLLNHLLIGKLHSVSKLEPMKYIFSLCESLMLSISKKDITGGYFSSHSK